VAKLIRWLHLSDFHTGKDDYAERRIFGQICDHVDAITKGGFKLDLIFMTGDIADKGSVEQYKTFNDEFLERLYDVVGIDYLDKTYIVPGNHDVQRQVLPGFDREFIASPQTHFFDANQEGEKLRTQQLFPRFKGFAENISTKVSKLWLESQQGSFADVIETNGGSYIGIVGINSAWLSKDEHDRHNLTPGIFLLEDTLKSLPKCDVYVVLGHHPIDWFLDEETDAIRRILGQYNAIYLHGHLHRARVTPEDGAGRGFLNVQCGAAFQIRDRVNEPWVNGLLWGALDIDNRQLMLQARNWDPVNGWPTTGNAFPDIRKIPGADWWLFPLPTSGEQSHIAAPTDVAEWSTPEGWQMVDHDFLNQRRHEPHEESVLRYFDGSTPDWRLALSGAIPKRLIVKNLVERLSSAQEKGKPQVTLLIGAGGEGKSTAFLQFIATLFDSGQSWSVIWRHDETKSFTTKKAKSLSVNENQWLIATDDADLIVDDLFEVVKSFHMAERSDVHFLFTCRDTDWIAAKGNLKAWTTVADFREIHLAGLELDDAAAIVHSWGKHGKQGLGRLAGKTEDEAIKLLFDAAVQESATEGGAFFGAMLEVRIGEELKEHLKALLIRLDERRLQTGGTLQVAFAYIASMHAEGLNFLSRPVLAKVLGYELSDLKSRVLKPLGKEAAATTSGEFVLTRHRTIARVAVELLSTNFSYDIDQLFIDLVAAAVSSPDYIPQLASWRYGLPEHFRSQEKKTLAVRIGQMVCEKEPENSFCFVHLAKLYRDIGNPELACEAFRGFSGDVRNDRGFYYEWGTAEGGAGNQALSVWLDAFSLSDQSAGGIPDNNRAKKSLAGLGVAFGEIYELYHDFIFLEAKMAVSVIGLTLRLDTTARSYFERYQQDSQAAGIQPMNIENAFEKFKAAVMSAFEYCPESVDFSTRISLPSEMTFLGLKRLIDNATQRN